MLAACGGFTSLWFHSPQSVPPFLQSTAPHPPQYPTYITKINSERNDTSSVAKPLLACIEVKPKTISCHNQKTDTTAQPEKSFSSPPAASVGVDYGVEMDSYKSRILDEVSWWFWYKNEIMQAGVSNCMRQCLNFFGTKRTHSQVPGLKGEALYLDKVFCCVCLS